MYLYYINIFFILYHNISSFLYRYIINKYDSYTITVGKYNGENKKNHIMTANFAKIYLKEYSQTQVKKHAVQISEGEHRWTSPSPKVFKVKFEGALNRNNLKRFLLNPKPCLTILI